MRGRPRLTGPARCRCRCSPSLSENVLRRLDILAEKGNTGAQELATYWVGQGVGLMNKVKPAREVVREMIEDYLDAVERVAGSVED